MAQTITYGHLLMLIGALALLMALVHVLRWFRQRDYGQGTPQYAAGRLSRRASLYALAIALILFAAGGLTPLCGLPLA